MSGAVKLGAEAVQTAASALHEEVSVLYLVLDCDLSDADRTTVRESLDRCGLLAGKLTELSELLRTAA